MVAPRGPRECTANRTIAVGGGVSEQDDLQKALDDAKA
jgi:hypothetical protein